MEINVTPDDVENLVKDSLVKAGLGKAISDAVTKAFSGWDSPIEKEIKAYVGEVVKELIRERFSEQIRAAVALEVEKRVTTQMIEETTSYAMKRIEERYS